MRCFQRTRLTYLWWFYHLLRSRVASVLCQDLAHGYLRLTMGLLISRARLLLGRQRIGIKVRRVLLCRLPGLIRRFLVRLVRLGFQDLEDVRVCGRYQL